MGFNQSWIRNPRLEKCRNKISLSSAKDCFIHLSTSVLWAVKLYLNWSVIGIFHDIVISN